MAVSCWRSILKRIVILQSFLRMLKLCKPAVCKLDLSRGGRCHSVLDNGLNLRWYIPSSIFMYVKQTNLIWKKYICIYKMYPSKIHITLITVVWSMLLSAPSYTCQRKTLQKHCKQWGNVPSVMVRLYFRTQLDTHTHTHTRSRKWGKQKASLINKSRINTKNERS